MKLSWHSGLPSISLRQLEYAATLYLVTCAIGWFSLPETTPNVLPSHAIWPYGGAPVVLQ